MDFPFFSLTHCSDVFLFWLAEVANGYAERRQNTGLIFFFSLKLFAWLYLYSVMMVAEAKVVKKPFIFYGGLES